MKHSIKHSKLCVANLLAASKQERRRHAPSSDVSRLVFSKQSELHVHTPHLRSSQAAVIVAAAAQAARALFS